MKMKIARTGLLLITMIPPALLSGGCVLLPAEGEMIARDVQKTRLDVLELTDVNKYSYEILSSWQQGFAEKQEQRYESLNNRLIDIELRLQRLEETLREIREALNQGAAVSPGQGPSETSTAATARDTRVTSTGLVISATEKLRAATELEVRMEYQEAIDLYREVLAEFPDSAVADDARFSIGQCYYYMGETEQALAEFRRTARDYPEGDRTPVARFRAAICEQRLGNTQAALETLEEILIKHPDYENSEKVRQYINDIQAGN